MLSFNSVKSIGFILLAIFFVTTKSYASNHPDKSATGNTLIIDFDDCQEAVLSDLGAAINEAKSGNHLADLGEAQVAASRMMAAMMAETTECCTTAASGDDAEQMTDGTGFGATDNILGLGYGAVAGGTGY